MHTVLGLLFQMALMVMQHGVITLERGGGVTLAWSLSDTQEAGPT